jgi:hypothetical protein
VFSLSFFFWLLLVVLVGLGVQNIICHSY